MNEREMIKPAGHQGIKPNVVDGQGYNAWRDPRLKSLTINIGVLMLIVAISGKTMEYVVDNFVMGPS